MLVNYDNSILSYIASIRNYFALDSSYHANEDFSNYLNKRKPEKIFLLLIDAMGISIIEDLLPKDSFIRKHIRYSCPTVFPTTTTAATTSIRNGKAPIENAWIGWSQYLKEVDDIIIPFRSKSYYSDKEYKGDVFFKNIPVEFTDDELNKKGIGATTINPAFDPDGCKSIRQMCSRLRKYSYGNEYKYIYAYWDKLDSIMHEKGVRSKKAIDHIAKLDKYIKQLCENLSDDTVLVVTADHGQIENKRYYDFYKSKYDQYFERYPSIEPRAMAFFIKDEYKDIFEKQFNEDFKDDYLLMKSKDALKMQIFGDRKAHPRAKEFIGNYFAIARSDLSFVYSIHNKEPFKGAHAGICKEELMIPVIVYHK